MTSKQKSSKDPKQKFYKDLGKRIREIREQKGMSLNEFESHDNSIDKPHMSKIENGLRNPTVYTLSRIAAILEVDIADFLKK